MAIGFETTVIGTASLTFTFVGAACFEALPDLEITPALDAPFESAIFVLGAGLAETGFASFTGVTFLTVLAASALIAAKRLASVFDVVASLPLPGGAFAGAAVLTLPVLTLPVLTLPVLTWAEADFALAFATVAFFGIADFTSELLSLAVLLLAVLELVERVVRVLAVVPDLDALFAVTRDFFLVAAILNYS